MYGTKLTPTLASTLGGLRGDSGVLVLALAGAGLAEQNALEPADVIHAVNGKPVDSVESLRDSLEAIPDGAPLVLQVERDGPAVLYRSRRHARRRAAPQEDRIPYACPRRHTAPAPVFLIEDRQASCCLSGQSLRRPFATDTERCIQDGGEGNQPADL